MGKGMDGGNTVVWSLEDNSEVGRDPFFKFEIDLSRIKDGKATWPLFCVPFCPFENKFVSENMDELALDISAGHGETLSTVAKLMNVENNAEFSAKLQANFSNIYANQNVTSATVIDSIAKYM